MSHLVLLNILGGALQVAEPLGAVGSQELLDQVLSVHVEVARELNLARQNLQQKKQYHWRVSEAITGVRKCERTSSTAVRAQHSTARHGTALVPAVLPLPSTLLPCRRNPCRR